MKRLGLLGGAMALAQWKANVIVDVMVTTVCDRRCPLCCVKDILGSRHVSAASVAKDVAALGDVGAVVLTGGEPTLHPDLGGVVAGAVEARAHVTPFGRYMRRDVNLITNGARLVESVGLLGGIHAVYLSVFGKGSGAGEPTDPGLAARFGAVRPEGMSFVPRVTVHRRGAGGNQPCGRHWRTLSVLDGKVFPCCVACGVTGASSTELSPGWEERVLDLVPPCGACVFGGDRDPTELVIL
jgi:hypothetical protein